MKTPIEQLEACVGIQCSDGNWNYDEYMFGFANGLILAEALMKGTEPKYLSRPEKFLTKEDGCAPSNPSNPNDIA